eukprot:TRINITY_DN28982_c0_g1_i1.p1 TRINITY_DN28982_c0_g1~~TRINITY_DN28982_c0_g1_i1.p1  ORF type:complete len:113 (+),score=17.54 TRINITY_DN28982_c0_g1_i1:352-690(+)
MPIFSSTNTFPLVLALLSVFAIMFAGVFVGLLSHFEPHSESEGACFKDDGYYWCDLVRDGRSLMSFGLGMLICCVFVCGEEEEFIGEDGEPTANPQNVCSDFVPLNLLAIFW